MYNLQIYNINNTVIVEIVHRSTPQNMAFKCDLVRRY